MNSKKMYRILLADRDSIFTDIALDAANSNGAKYVPIEQLEAVANGMCRKYPSTGKYHTVTLIGNVLTIDKDSDNILTIEEVEVMELDKPQLSNQEAKDILDEINPVLNRQGIANPDNHENLN